MSEPDTKPCDGPVRLFIGGDADGRRIRLPEDLVMYDRLIAVKGREVESQRYRLHRLAGGSECYAVMVWDGIDLDECLRRLLEAYNAQSDDARLEN